MVSVSSVIVAGVAKKVRICYQIVRRQDGRFKRGDIHHSLLAYLPHPQQQDPVPKYHNRPMKPLEPSSELKVCLGIGTLAVS